MRHANGLTIDGIGGAARGSSSSSPAASIISSAFGFTLIELMVTIAIIGTLAAIAIPNAIAWRTTAQFNTAVREVKSAIESTRMAALRNNLSADVNFAAANTFNTQTQQILLGAATPGTVTTHQMPPGVTIKSTTFASGGVAGRLRFTNRGLVVPAGRVEIEGANGLCRAIFVSTVGSSRIDLCP